MTELFKSSTHEDVYLAAKTGHIRHILLAGPKGVGKTTACFEVADRLKRMAWKWQLHAESTPSEGYGMHVPHENSFIWVPGPIDLAYSKGGILILDEIAEASGPVKTALYGALDDGRGGSMTYVGKTFVPHKRYMALATMNDAPWEGSLPDALLDRFDAVFCILAPSETQLALLDPDLRETCEVAYESAPDPMEGPEVTYRMLVALQKLRAVMTLDKAVLAACKGNADLAGKLLETLAVGKKLTGGAALASVADEDEDEDDEDWEDEDEDDEDEDEDDEDEEDEDDGEDDDE